VFHISNFGGLELVWGAKPTNRTVSIHSDTCRTYSDGEANYHWMWWTTRNSYL